MPDGLKIVTKTGSIIYDSTLIAGVDYTPQNVHHPNHYVQNSYDDDSSDDETYTQSTETTVDSEDDLDYRSETSAPQGEQEWIIPPRTFTILITTFKIEKYERLLLLLPCIHLDLILPRVLLIVTFLGRYLLSAVGLLSICLFFLGTISESLDGDDAPTDMSSDIFTKNFGGEDFKRDIYVRKNPGVSYNHAHGDLFDVPSTEGWTPCIAEPEKWMRKNGNVYEYIGVYVDDMALGMKDP
jgi:hypothetical protein